MTWNYVARFYKLASPQLNPRRRHRRFYWQMITPADYLDRLRALTCVSSACLVSSLSCFPCSLWLRCAGRSNCRIQSSVPCGDRRLSLCGASIGVLLGILARISASSERNSFGPSCWGPLFLRCVCFCSVGPSHKGDVTATSIDVGQCSVW